MRVEMRIDPNQAKPALGRQRLGHAAPAADGAGMVAAQHQELRAAAQATVRQRQHGVGQCAVEARHGVHAIARMQRVGSDRGAGVNVAAGMDQGLGQAGGQQRAGAVLAATVTRAFANGGADDLHRGAGLVHGGALQPAAASAGARPSAQP
ncbi:hypothetical protein D3C71_1705380 [compost metagenome]